jgi:hypothetical protein
MFHACVLNDGPKWDHHLPLAEFFYNNSYQESLKVSPFKETTIFGPDIVTEAEEKVKQICQKSYTDKRRHRLEFVKVP